MRGRGARHVGPDRRGARTRRLNATPVALTVVIASNVTTLGAIEARGARLGHACGHCGNGASPTGPYPGMAMRTVYLDHAATTPMQPAAIEAMTDVLATVGNASSLHTSGRAARRRMEEAREALARLLGARPSEIVFTAGGTESDNLAVKGVYWARRDA